MSGNIRDTQFAQRLNNTINQNHSGKNCGGVWCTAGSYILVHFSKLGKASSEILEQLDKTSEDNFAEERSLAVLVTNGK